MYKTVLRAAMEIPALGVRCVHSKRQIKRMNFKRMRREGTLPKDLSVLNKPPAQPVKYPAPENEFPDGYIPPPETVPTHLEFAVLRSKNGWLPVYTRYRNRLPFTKVRHVYGNNKAFLAEFEKVAGYTPKQNEGGSITTFEVKGNHVTNVRRWLASLGF